MLLNATELIKTIKRVAVDAVEAQKPVNILHGVVTSEEPLQISIDQKTTLGPLQLELSRNVTDHIVKISGDISLKEALGGHRHSLEGETEKGGDPEHFHMQGGKSSEVDLAHTHAVDGEIEVTVHNRLLTGDKVIMLRVQGGMKYLVLDRAI